MNGSTRVERNLRAPGVLAASKVLGAALGPQPNAITAHSITSCTTDLEYGGKRMLGIVDILTDREGFSVLSLSLLDHLAAEG